jgi:Fic family protein
LSLVIQNNKKHYYDAIARQNTTLNLNDWTLYFADLIIEAQRTTLAYMEFILQKARFTQQHEHQLHERQWRVVERVLRAGVEGFAQGLTVKKYIRLSGASRATATRDLQHLVEQEVFIRTGETQSTRYWLNLPELETFKRLSAFYPEPNEYAERLLDIDEESSS